MNKIRLFFLLRKNTKLSEKRNPMFEANQYGKLFGYIMASILAIEFIALGTFLGWLAAKEDIPEMLFYIMPFMLILDFGMRFMTQQTPLMLVKPYLLTPISKYTAIDCFLVRQVFDAGNLFWMVIFLPYIFIVWCGGVTFWTAIGMLFLLHFMVVVNSQWYLLVRTLINQSMFWWALPAAFYGLLIVPFFVLPDDLLDKYTDFIEDTVERMNSFWWLFLLFAVVFIVLFAINRYLQMHLVYDEISSKEKAKLKHVSQFTALDRFGQIGEYLKLELKSVMRNKAIRTRFLQAVILPTIFSLCIAFLDIYKTSFERNFFCLYAFIFFGAANLVKIMCPEGNYIDLLMVHKENILTLLRAKYYFYCAVLLLPLLITLIPVFTGKFTILMILAYLLTATGPVYFMLFQLAVWNKQSLPLNDKITGKNQMENKWQGIASMVAMFAPVILVLLLQAIFSETVAYITLIIIGAAFTLTESWWLRNIYRRMMKRRYANLEGFHATR
ncbi:MAG: hypothetical protein E7107_10840 [Prevotella sp.]|jgi:hypothetical protein|nr:hypothetical protein [Prevotella sp.]